MQRKLTSLALRHVGLIVYGGTNLETGLVMKSALDAGFSRYVCRNAWDKVGAMPLTRRAAHEN
jgi:hypothetical protein